MTLVDLDSLTDVHIISPRNTHDIDNIHQAIAEWLDRQSFREPGCYLTVVKVEADAVLLSR